MKLDDDTYTSSEVAAILGKFPSVISRHIREGRISAYRRGKYRIITYEAIAQWGGVFMARQVKSGVLFVRLAPLLIDKATRGKADINVQDVTQDVCARCIEEQPITRGELERIIKETVASKC